MASTGNVFAGTGENNAGIGATAWTNPGNVISDNATDATCAAAASSQYLVARNYAFSAVPTNATIDGITVRAEASEHTSGTEVLNARLQDASAALFGASKTATISGTTKAVYTYGGTADLWSATITGNIVHDADFGVRFWFTTAHDVRVDYVTMAVEYTVPSHGIATETDVALALGVVKIRATGVSPETDTAIACVVENVASIIEIPTGLAAETDASLSLGKVKIRATGLSAETEAALGLGRVKIRTVGLVAETDASLALGVIKNLSVSVSLESDAALAGGIVKQRATGLSTETDASINPGVVKQVACGISAETDASFSIYVSATLVSVGISEETDIAIIPGLIDQVIRRVSGYVIEVGAYR